MEIFLKNKLLNFYHMYGKHSVYLCMGNIPLYLWYLPILLDNLLLELDSYQYVCVKLPNHIVLLWNQYTIMVLWLRNRLSLFLPFYWTQQKEIAKNSPAIIIIQIVKIRSLSVSAATFPNPTDVMHVMVKYSAVTYMVFLDGPFISSGVDESLGHTYEYGFWVIFASFQSQLYWTPLSASDRPMEYHIHANQWATNM